MIPFDYVLSQLKKSPDPISDILRSAAYFLPLQLLYCDLVKNKDLKPLVDLSNEEKQSYWSLVVEKEDPKYVKIWKCQSLYVYNWLNNPTDGNKIK